MTYTPSERPPLLKCDKTAVPPCLFADTPQCIVHGGKLGDAGKTGGG